MAFIVINRRDKKELRRIADALERIADYLQPQLIYQDDSMEIVSIDKQKKTTLEDDEMPESSRM